MRALPSNVWLLLAFGAGCNNTTRAIDSLEPAQSRVSVAAPSPVPAAGSCGQKGLPDCPLQGWMKSTLQAYQRAGNYARLETAFQELGDHAPAGFDSWKTLAAQGAQAAKVKDDAATRRVCKDCHDQNRTRYRRELRTTPIW